MSFSEESTQARQDGGPVSTRVRHRCIFTRKLERKLKQKGMDIPFRILSLLDTPFEEFGDEELSVYETQVKPLAFVLAEHLQEVYEEMGCPRSGWEDALGRLKDSPIKVIAALVLHEEDRKASASEEEAFAGYPEETTQKVRVRVTPTKPAKKEKWWKRRIF